MKLDWEKQAEEYNMVWDRRYQTPSINENWVENDRVKGRTQYLTFLIREIDDSIIKRIKKIQTEISQFSCVEPFPPEYFHITIKGAGFIVPQKTEKDEITTNDIPRIIREAKTRLKEYSPFEIKLENLNNFIEAIIIQAHDGGVTRHIHENFSEIPGFIKSSYYPGYLPHLSIAQYKSRVQYEKLIKYMEENREKSVGSLKIDAIQLIIAHLPVEGRFPRLETIEEFKL